MKAEDHKKGLTAERLRDLLSYDRHTGIFTRKISVCNSIRIGDVAGSIDKKSKYVRIFVDGNKYLGHRLAWLYVYGEWPNDMLDHKDGNKSYNAIENLRDASNVENVRNSPVRKDNLLGIKCVRLHETGRYHARIYHDGKFKSLGLHDTPEAASDAYARAAKELFGEFARAS